MSESNMVISNSANSDGRYAPLAWKPFRTACVHLTDTASAVRRVPPSTPNPVELDLSHQASPILRPRKSVESRTRRLAMSQPTLSAYTDITSASVLHGRSAERILDYPSTVRSVASHRVLEYLGSTLLHSVVNFAATMLCGTLSWLS